MKSILHTVEIGADPSTVYRSLTTQEGLAAWWSTRVTADEGVGGQIAFEFTEVFNPRMEITALRPEELVGWKCVGGHDPWDGSEFRFEIRPDGIASVLLFRQDYTRDLPDSDYGTYNFNWSYYLRSLKRLCETGTGSPFGASPDDLRLVVERFVEEYKNRHNPGIVDELVAEDCKLHLPVMQLPPGREGMRLNGQIMCGAFPDVQVDREFFVVEGDLVVERAHARATHAGRLMSTEPTGRPVTWTELHAYRVRNGQITEVWSEADFFGILMQIGAVDAPPR